jgi:microsomal dipeptidase-like Zn-dependent dipeptidase
MAGVGGSMAGVEVGTRYLVVDALQHSKPERARFEEWRDGGLGCAHVTLAIWEDARATISVITDWHDLFREHGDLIGLARSVDDIERIAASGRTAVVFGFQNAAPLEDDLGLVRVFHELGVRIVQLTYNVQNHVGSGCWEEHDSGLSTFFGRNVISEMNELGMLVDISHCGERTSLDAIEYSAAPVAATHANPTEFVGNVKLAKRTKSTELLRRLAGRGGVVGLSPYPNMLPGGSDTDLETFLDMIVWTVEQVGVDHVGFGTDFHTGYPDSIIKWWRAGRWARESPVPITGGLAKWPDWFSSPARFPGVLEGLEARGVSAPDIAQIAGDNWMRLFRETFRGAGSADA